MPSSTSIVNEALVLLGEARILSLDDNSKPAREAKAIYDQTRDAVLAAYNWSFAKKRLSIPALAEAPAFGYSLKYQLPGDCLRLVYVGDYYVGADLTDYRGSDTSEFTVEGRTILANWSAPLNIIYIHRNENPNEYSAPFTQAFAARLAIKLAETLTQSNTKKESVINDFNMAISQAIRSNAIELPPQKLADDEWILSRL